MNIRWAVLNLRSYTAMLRIRLTLGKWNLNSATAAKPTHDLGKVRATEIVDLFKVEHIYLSSLQTGSYWKSFMISQRVTAPMQLTFFSFFYELVRRSYQTPTLVRILRSIANGCVLLMLSKRHSASHTWSSQEYPISSLRLEGWLRLRAW